MSALELLLKNQDSLAETGLEGALPAILARAGNAACFAVDEFFSARISNPHTRNGLRPCRVLISFLVRGPGNRARPSHARLGRPLNGARARRLPLVICSNRWVRAPFGSLLRTGLSPVAQVLT